MNRIQFSLIALSIAMLTNLPTSAAPQRARQLPDLQITSVDLSGNRVTIKNCGTAPVMADQTIYISWSEASYTKPGWNSSSYVPMTGALLPGRSVVFTGLWADVDGNGLDARTRFCVDADGTIPELDECNNSVDGSGRLLGGGSR